MLSGTESASARISPMNTHEAIGKRRSMRGYLDKPIEEDRLTRLFTAAQLAPSTHNDQAYKLVIVREKKTLRALAEAAAKQTFIAEAPVVIAAVSLEPSYYMRSGIPGHTVDVAIALDHITLAATEEGLGTCWIGAFHQDQVKQILGIPGSFQVVALMTVGYPDYAPESRTRKPLSQLLCYERFHE
jgi:nitroreductase